MNVLVFDIETVPDTEGGSKLYGLEDLNPADIAAAMMARQQQKSGNDFLPLHLHRIIAVSAVLRSHNSVKVWSLGNTDSCEKDLIQRFFDGIEKFTPSLVSWNGVGFDLPVLHYRALLHGVCAQRYWDTGSGQDREFKWNNYLNRYHYRHLDLMDVLAAYQQRARAPLDHIATLLGFPGKMGMSGANVWEYYQREGGITDIRHYCETDVLNTYLVFLRFEVMRGNYDETRYQHECQLLADYLGKQNQPHFDEFLQRWHNAPQNNDRAGRSDSESDHNDESNQT